MIDTLKLARRMEAAGMQPQQAEALAEGLSDGLKDGYVTNERLDVALSKLKTELIVWIVGTVGLGVLANHFWR
jgi:hypothetical protein